MFGCELACLERRYCTKPELGLEAFDPQQVVEYAHRSFKYSRNKEQLR